MMQTLDPPTDSIGGTASSPSPRSFKRPACNSCRVAHVACENARPCHRCNLLGKGEQCKDANVKKRGRPRKSVNGTSGASPSSPTSSSSDGTKGASSATSEETDGASPSTAPRPAPKRARANAEVKPLPAVLPRPTAGSASIPGVKGAPGIVDPTVSGNPPSTNPVGGDLPRLPPPASLLRLGQQSDYATIASASSLPPLPHSAGSPPNASPLLYPSILISLFQNAVGLAPSSNTPPSAGNGQLPRTSAQASGVPAATGAGMDWRNGPIETSLTTVLDAIKEMRESNEHMRKELAEIKSENAQLRKEKEELKKELDNQT